MSVFISGQQIDEVFGERVQFRAGVALTSLAWVSIARCHWRFARWCVRETESLLLNWFNYIETDGTSDTPFSEG